MTGNLLKISIPCTICLIHLAAEVAYSLPYCEYMLLLGCEFCHNTCRMCVSTATFKDVYCLTQQCTAVFLWCPLLDLHEPL